MIVNAVWMNLFTMIRVNSEIAWFNFSETSMYVFNIQLIWMKA